MRANCARTLDPAKIALPGTSANKPGDTADVNTVRCLVIAMWLQDQAVCSPGISHPGRHTLDRQ